MRLKIKNTPNLQFTEFSADNHKWKNWAAEFGHNVSSIPLSHYHKLQMRKFITSESKSSIFLFSNYDPEQIQHIQPPRNTNAKNRVPQNPTHWSHRPKQLWPWTRILTKSKTNVQSVIEVTTDSCHVQRNNQPQDRSTNVSNRNYSTFTINQYAVTITEH